MEIMKRTVLTFLLAAFVAMVSVADDIRRPVTLLINDMQCVLLSFPSAVKYVDFGSSDIAGSRTAHPNILSVKSEIPFFEETTASVVTADGRYYSFVLKYGETLPGLAVYMQTVKESVLQSDYYETHNISLSDIKTSHILFDRRVTDIITGSDSIIADYADNIDNIVRCKAVSNDFGVTSLSIITENGDIYPFSVSFDPSPAVMSVQAVPDTRHKPVAVESFKGQAAMFNDRSVNENQMLELGKRVVNHPMNLHLIGKVSQNMIFGLTALYIHNDIIMFRFDLENNSNIDYEVDFIKIYIADKKRGKTAAQQEDELTPIYTYSPSGNDMMIKGKSSKTVVCFFRRFTVPVNRLLYIEAFEKNGGRHIYFSVGNKVILQASGI